MLSFRLFRTNRDSDAAQLQQMKDVVAQSRELLQKQPMPTTFAGRKTQEPFPCEEKTASH